MSNTTESGANRGAADRPDWILYTVPSIAFVIGLVLFTLICKTQRHREKADRRISALKTIPNGTTTNHDYTCPGFTGAQMEKEASLKKQEAQSYENVSAAIYSNQSEVTYYVSQDEDYITPDEMGDAATASEQNHNNYLHPPRHMTDTDAESYENMEGCLYAQPRNNAFKLTVSIDDDEAYENMEGNATFRSPATHNSTNTLDDESYVRMDSIQTPNDRWEASNARGESERRTEGEREMKWYYRQKTV